MASDRYRRLDHRPRLRAAADYDDPLLELHGHLDVDGGRRIGAHRHCIARGRREAGQREGHDVRAGRQRGDCEPAGAVGENGPLRTAVGRAAHLHRDAGQNEARRVGDRAGQHPVLGAGGCGRECGGAALPRLRCAPGARRGAGGEPRAAGGRFESDHRRGDVAIITTPGRNPRKHWSDPVYGRSVIGLSLPPCLLDATPSTSASAPRRLGVLSSVMGRGFWCSSIRSRAASIRPREPAIGVGSEHRLRRRRADLRRHDGAGREAEQPPAGRSSSGRADPDVNPTAWPWNWGTSRAYRVEQC